MGEFAGRMTVVDSKDAIEEEINGGERGAPYNVVEGSAHGAGSLEYGETHPVGYSHRADNDDHVYQR